MSSELEHSSNAATITPAANGAKQEWLRGAISQREPAPASQFLTGHLAAIDDDDVRAGDRRCRVGLQLEGRLGAVGPQQAVPPVRGIGRIDTDPGLAVHDDDRVFAISRDHVRLLALTTE